MRPPIRNLTPLILLFASNSLAGPQVLSDEQMDGITAGTGGEIINPGEVATGGSVTANQGQTTLVHDASVSLADNSQFGASSVSLVNAADGLSAGGINLWNGASADTSVDQAINVLQSNELAQSVSPRYAALLDFHRRAGHVRDVQTVADSSAVTQKILFGLDLNIPGVGNFEAGTEIPASVIPGAKIPGAYGNVIGFAGDLGVEYDGGWFEAGFALNASLDTAAHLTSESSSSLFWGLLDLGGTEISSSTAAGASFNPYIYLGWELPDLSVNGEGAVCFANGGECRASILDRDIGRLDIRSAFAEHIVVDRSGLNVHETFRVDLAAEAQASARAVNLANLAGGLVANGANLATAGDEIEAGSAETSAVLATDHLMLEQQNLIMQTAYAPELGPQFEGRRRHLPTPGGVIVTTESAATLAKERAVTATSGAQAGARAVSLVNASDAFVATGLNIWDGRLQQSSIGDRFELEQSNELQQTEGVSVASLNDYERDSESMHGTTTYARSRTTPKSLGTTFDLTVDNPATGDPIVTANGHLAIPASLIPTSKIPGVGGTAAAFAGNVDVLIDGGTAEFGFGIVESGAYFNTQNSADGDTGASLGIIEFEGEGHLDYSVDATLGASLALNVEMPDLEVMIDGAACFAQKGNCEAGVMDRDIGELHIDHALADYIVLDRSLLGFVDASGVLLDSSAQSGARAVSLVNAAGGQIAVGANVASWRGDESQLTIPLVNIYQDNQVTQQPEWVAGGTVPGGVIVGYESAADIGRAGAVMLMGGAQSDARALSLVNSASANVANGINLWTGAVSDIAIDDSLNVAQSNFIVQQAPQETARLLRYDRDGEWSRTVHTAATTKPAGESDDGFYPQAIPGQIYGESSLRIGDFVALDRTGNVPTSIIPTSKIPGGKPGALAVAGMGYLHYDGGRVTLESSGGVVVDHTTDAGASGAASAFFGIVGGSANNSYVEHTQAGSTANLLVDVELPDLTIEVDGALCIAKGADCASSTVERDVGPMYIPNANGEYIVVDRSQLTVNEHFEVMLADNAQADARALLLVNAAGGDVANGLNVARLQAASLSTQPNSAQSSVVIQGVGADAFAVSEERRRYYGGGTIVANESAAALFAAAQVGLDAGAQSGARAIALVNAADALVANGINVWDGDLDQATFDHAVNLAQTNQVLQAAAPSVARVGGYHRGTDRFRDVHTFADSRIPQQFIKAAFRIDLLDLGSYYEGLTMPAAAIPTSKIPGAHGIVAGFAGEADVTYGGGMALMGYGMDSWFHYDNLARTDAAAGDFLGFGSADGFTEFGIDAFDIHFAPSLFFAAGFSTLDIDAEGALCWANGGTCTAGILDVEEGAICVDDIQAEHIAIDRSALDVSESYIVALGASAQADARAMAIVNAAGGLVANSINVANVRGTTMSTPTFNVVQRNVVNQGR